MSVEEIFDRVNEHQVENAASPPEGLPVEFVEDWHMATFREAEQSRWRAALKALAAVHRTRSYQKGIVDNAIEERDQLRALLLERMEKCPVCQEYEDGTFTWQIKGWCDLCRKAQAAGVKP